MENKPESPASTQQFVGRTYHCNNCGWHGSRVAHCVATITGGQYNKDTVAMSVCPCCTGIFSTLRRVFSQQTDPPSVKDHRADAAKEHK